ncbi:MAG TPA: RDD family protein [Flavitalea sp.]|nr:RDD family protein [Flavitalea sp.]
METREQNILTDLEQVTVTASQGKRLTNYLIDLFSFYIIVAVAGVIIAYMGQDAFVEEAYSRSYTNFVLLDRLLGRLFGFLLYASYMFFIETVFKGKSLGKLITGTRAVMEDGSRIPVKISLLRSLSRAVPFELFSALGSGCNPWHDRWTNTMVIDEKESGLLQK